MKKKYLIILLLTMILMPFKVLAAGGFRVSNSSVTMYPGEKKNITISSYDSVGKLNISSSNGGVASISVSSTFIDSVGASKTFTITANSIGSATISVVGSENYASYSDEVSLEGSKKTITVNVIQKPESQPTNPSQPPTNLSKNNNIKNLSVEGYKLIKVDNNNYTLTVSSDVTSINIKATAEDSKAKVSGTGVKKLQIGKNNFEVIVTSEAGNQNKITIKVTRKDGYYLEDLDSVLSNEKLQEVDIIINSDSEITNEQLINIKNSNKTLRLNYYDENRKLIYSWIINGKEIKDSKEFSTSISFTTENEKEIYKLSNYADGIYVNFKHTGDLPTGIKIKLYVGDKFENGDVLNLYQYNNFNKTLELVKNNLKVTDEYIEIEHCSDCFITMSTISSFAKDVSYPINIFIIIAIIELVIIISLIVFIAIKFRSNKKINLVAEVKNNSMNYENNNTNIEFISNIDAFSSINSSNCASENFGEVNSMNYEDNNENIEIISDINDFSDSNNNNIFIESSGVDNTNFEQSNNSNNNFY